MQTILVLNSGSSSLKLKVIDLESDTTVFELNISETTRNFSYELVLTQAINKLKEHMAVSPIELDAVAHRVVHGGELFTAPVLITEAVIGEIEKLIPLAPLHLPGNLAGIQMCLDKFPDVPQVALFDTAFHKDLPDYAYLYPLPKQWRTEYGIRKYGFHGASHGYLAVTTAKAMQQPVHSLNLITLHLGNGASLCAIRKGISVDTSMGFTPVAGVMMGTRSGDLDPIIPLYVQHSSGMGQDEVNNKLTAESGLEAVCGSHDMREILSRMHCGDVDAKLAVDMFVYRVRKAIGEYMVVLGHVDAIVFSGGIGENCSEIRVRCCENLERFGICLDEEKNNQFLNGQCQISSDESLTGIFVINTNEEYQLAQQTRLYLSNFS
ncbi:acetate/propionate family kinase [Methylophaga sp.]|uniref:acetate/propionate family kinase n=1 Tax=Methylophaga sp. TaxID=2024840 RepID=UPI00140137D1|nr:acetate/propionate family kinase [Methylophaga sp.]MTI62519.1 acetate/propionate family kinase [Methylophaga sp.]